MREFLKKMAIYGGIFFLTNLLLGWGLKELGPAYSEAEYGQVKWDDFHSLESGSLDVLFMGSSHFLSGIDPAVIDSVSGLTSYNMARVGLRPASAFVLLSEVLQTQSPRVLVLDIFHRTFVGAGYNHLYDFGYTDMGGDKPTFALEHFSLSEQIRLFFPAYTYRSNLPKLRPLLGLRSDKSDWEQYHYKGYIEHPETVSERKLQQNEFVNYEFSESSIEPASISFLDKLLTLCEKKGIRVIWVSTPIPEICLNGIKNPEEIDTYFNELSDSRNIPYLNYNSPDLRQLAEFADLEDFSDDDHLNTAGAIKLSASIGQYLKTSPG